MDKELDGVAECHTDGLNPKYKQHVQKSWVITSTSIIRLTNSCMHCKYTQGNTHNKLFLHQFIRKNPGYILGCKRNTNQSTKSLTLCPDSVEAAQSPTDTDQQLVHAPSNGYK